VVNAIDLLAGYLTGGLLLLFIVVFAMIRPQGRVGGSVETVR
jgi:hypothetical protein